MPRLARIRISLTRAGLPQQLDMESLGRLRFDQYTIHFACNL